MIYFLSDAHLGSLAIANPEEHQKRVADLLRQMGNDATAIYLLGDIFDFWFEYYWGNPKGYDLFLDTLRTLTDKGIEIHYFIGNHDIWTFGYLEQRTGVTVHREPQIVTLSGKRCFLAHGDGLGSDNRHFLLLRRFFRNPTAQFLFRLLPPSWGNALGYKWAKHSRLKELANPIAYQGENSEELIRFAKQTENTEHFDYYIFGHRHIELDLALATGARVVILGDTFRLWTYAALDENGMLTLMNTD